MISRLEVELLVVHAMVWVLLHSRTHIAEHHAIMRTSCSALNQQLHLHDSNQNMRLAKCIWATKVNRLLILELLLTCC